MKHGYEGLRNTASKQVEVVDMDSGETILFPSLKTACNHLGINLRRAYILTSRTNGDCCIFSEVNDRSEFIMTIRSQYLPLYF